MGIDQAPKLELINQPTAASSPSQPKRLPTIPLLQRHLTQVQAIVITSISSSTSGRNIKW